MTSRKPADAVGAPVTPFEALVAFIICTSFACIGLLTFQKFYSVTALAIGGALTAAALAWMISKRSFSWRDSRFTPELLAILLLALFFRSQPALYVPGGQDQGVYINMSEHLDRAGGPYLHDRSREIFAEHGLARYYDQENIYYFNKIMEGYQGQFQPGVYISDIDRSRYLFQFYHLHPAWMAIAAKVLGPYNRAWSLVFFSLICIISLYLITWMVAPIPRLSAGILGLLLAINQAHVYFSRFPLTEMVASSLICTGVYFAFRAYQLRTQNRPCGLELLLSWGLFTCFFFTRISGFIWLPFFYVIGALAMLFEWQPSYRREFITYAFGAVGSYALSAVYGWHLSFPYAFDIYRLELPGVFTRNWQLAIPLGLIVAVGMPWAASLLIRKKPHLLDTARSTLPWAQKIPYVIFLACVAACAWIMFSITFPDSPLAMAVREREHWLKDRTGLAGMQHAALWVDFVQLTPLIFFAVFIGARQLSRRANVMNGLILLILAFSWFYAGYGQRFMPYLYYSLRYQLMELIPFSLLAASIALATWLRAKGARRVYAIAALSFAIPFGLYFSSAQLKGSEMQGVASSLQRIVDQVHKEDLLLLWGAGGNFTDVRTPLKIYFDRTTAHIRDPEDIHLVMSDLILSWPVARKAYLLTSLPADHPFLKKPYLDDPLSFKMEMGHTIQLGRISDIYNVTKEVWRLYPVNREKLRAFTKTEKRQRSGKIPSNEK